MIGIVCVRERERERDRERERERERVRVDFFSQNWSKLFSDRNLSDTKRDCLFFQKF